MLLSSDRGTSPTQPKSARVFIIDGLLPFYITASYNDQGAISVAVALGATPAEIFERLLVL